MGNIGEARRAFKKAVEASPDRWISYLYYAIFLNAITENDSAQATLKRMLTRDPHIEAQSPSPFGFFEEKVLFSEYLETYESVMSKTSGDERELGKLYISFLMNGPHSSAGKKIELTADKGSLLQRHVPAGSVRAPAHIWVDETAIWEVDTIEVEVRRDGEEPIRGLKGGISMIEFKTQQEIFPQDELPLATKEAKTIRAFGTHPTGDWQRMHVHQRVIDTSEDKKRVLSKDGVVTFEDVLLVWIHNIALIANAPAIRDRLEDQAVFDL
jgi:hypothetical protein